jgi:hypothetical protein
MDGNATNWGGTSITVDDGSCVYCSNSSGSNYYTGATVDCNGDPIGTWGLNWDSCCTGLTYGCLDDGVTTNSTYVAQRPSSWVGQASNYCGTCNVHSATCIYEGCTDATALNATPGATTDDGSCQYCSDSNANNYWGASAPRDCAGVSGGTNYGCCTYTGCNDPSAIAGTNPGGNDYHVDNTHDCAGVLNGANHSCCNYLITGCMDNGNKDQTWYITNQYTGGGSGIWPNPYGAGPHPAAPTIKGHLYPGDYGHGAATNYVANATVMIPGSCTYNCMWHIYEHCDTGVEVVFNTFSGGGGTVNTGYSCSNNQSAQNWMNRPNSNISAGFYANSVKLNNAITLKLDSQCTLQSGYVLNATEPCFKYKGLRNSKGSAQHIHIKGYPWVSSSNTCSNGNGQWELYSGCSSCNCPPGSKGPC